MMTCLDHNRDSLADRSDLHNTLQSLIYQWGFSISPSSPIIKVYNLQGTSDGGFLFFHKLSGMDRGWKGSTDEQTFLTRLGNKDTH